MLKALVSLLYWLAIMTGVAGLVAGGVPLVNYALARWRNPAFDYYSNFGLISTAGNMIVLSLMLLVFVHLSCVIRRRFDLNSRKSATSGKQRQDPSPPADSIPKQVAPPKEPPASATPDEKLAQLVTVKKEIIGGVSRGNSVLKQSADRPSMENQPENP